jgi:hypothetical protein
MKEIYVIFNPYENGYYNGEGLFKGILFCKKYFDRESAVLDIEKIFNNSNGRTFLKIELFYVNG